MKTMLGLCALMLAMLARPALARTVPTGFLPYADLAKAQEQAKASNKLLAIVAKGFDDTCPRCAAALENGTRTVRSDCVMVFMRVAELRKEPATLPAKLQEVSRGAAEGASVYFYIFDAQLETLIAKADRKQLENDKDALRALKKAVSEARKNAKGPGAGSAVKK